MATAVECADACGAEANSALARANRNSRGNVAAMGVKQRVQQTVI